MLRRQHQLLLLLLRLLLLEVLLLRHEARWREREHWLLVLKLRLLVLKLRLLVQKLLVGLLLLHLRLLQLLHWSIWSIKLPDERREVLDGGGWRLCGASHFAAR